jgi:hypothetical protein
MTTENAIDIVTGEIDSDEATYIKACQYLIDTGIAWTEKGYVGSKCLQMLQRGICKRS